MAEPAEATSDPDIVRPVNRKQALKQNKGKAAEKQRIS